MGFWLDFLGGATLGLKGGLSMGQAWKCSGASESVDWFQCSVGAAVAGEIESRITRADVVDGLLHQNGFQAADRRRVMFSGCVDRVELERAQGPRQLSTSLGGEYVFYRVRGAGNPGEFLSLVRGLGGIIRPSRLDVAFDLYGAEFKPADLREAFEGLHRRDVLHKWAESEISWMSAWATTWYTGSRASGKLLRVYSKGLAELQKDGPHRERRPPVDPSWLRIEVEYGGEHAQRVFAAGGLTSSLSAVFGAARSDVAMWVPGVVPGQLEAAPREFRAPSDSVRSLAYVVDRYGPLISAAKFRGINVVDLCLSAGHEGGSRERTWIRHVMGLSGASARDVERVIGGRGDVGC